MFDEECHFYLTVKVGYELWLTSEFWYGSFLSQRNVNWKVFLGMVPRFPTWPRGDKLNFLEGNFEFPQAPGGIYKGLGPNAASTTSCSRLSSSYIIWWEISHEKIWFLMKRISETLFPIFFFLKDWFPIFISVSHRESNPFWDEIETSVFFINKKRQSVKRNVKDT